MKSIFFARHSFAESSYSGSDFERNITEDGYSRIEEQASLLAKESAHIDRIICSSANRTMQTSNYYKRLLKISAEIESHKWLYYDFLTDELQNFIHKQDNLHSSIMLVGHNPTISLMANNFSNSGNYNFYPGAILRLDFDIDSWSDLCIREGKESLFLI